MVEKVALMRPKCQEGGGGGEKVGWQSWGVSRWGSQPFCNHLM